MTQKVELQVSASDFSIKNMKMNMMNYDFTNSLFHYTHIYTQKQEMMVTRALKVCS